MNNKGINKVIKAVIQKLKLIQLNLMNTQTAIKINNILILMKNI